MTEKYFPEGLPSVREAADPDGQIVEMADALRSVYEAQMENYAFQNALTEVFRLISRANKYIDETAPWLLGRDPEKTPRLASVLYNLLEVIRISAVLLAPFMPDTGSAILDRLGLCAEDARAGFPEAAFRTDTAYRIRKGEALFPRIDLQKELAALEADQVAARAEDKSKPQPEQAPPAEDAKPDEKAEGIASLIDIADFARVELRVARVLSCERVPKSDKLLLLKLDDGFGGRQVVSGIAAWYTPEALVGRKLIVVFNLKPAKLRGVLSQGMILAADVNDAASVIFVEDGVPCGAKVR
jgi:methionyl-tRNA synthetase